LAGNPPAPAIVLVGFYLYFVLKRRFSRRGELQLIPAIPMIFDGSLQLRAT
jgi:hypothetical protein